MLISFVILAAQNRSSTYGWHEWSCSNGPCIVGVSVTASGEKLSHSVPSAALPLPKNVKMVKPFWIHLKTETGPCTAIRINDRTSSKLVGKRGFDLSPAALYALTGQKRKNWSGKLTLCSGEEETEVNHTNKIIDNFVPYRLKFYCDISELPFFEDVWSKREIVFDNIQEVRYAIESACEEQYV